MKGLLLPPLEDVPALAQYLEATHNYDMDKHTRLIYHPISGIVYKRRFVLALKMLAGCVERRTERIVEVGYGAGLLLPTLSSMAEEVIGVDVLDPRASCAIYGMLRKLQIGNVRLVAGSVLNLPLSTESVDVLLCLSVLEHLQRGEEMEQAAREIARLLRRDAVAILGFPVKNKITRFLFRILGYDDDVIHPSSHSDILEGCGRQRFRLEALRRFPAFLPLDLGLYALAQVRKPGSAA
jgi:2-polyprenyl-3-methyl-5-hydroxy-6-metoxy-1,4-benzoquinol methylase